MTTIFELNRQPYTVVSGAEVEKVDGVTAVKNEASDTPADAEAMVSNAGSASEKSSEATNSVPGVIVRHGYSPYATRTVAAQVTVANPTEEEMLLAIAPALYSYHIGYDEEVLKSEKQQQVIMGFNGLFVRRREEFDGNIIAVIDECKKVPGLRSVKTGLDVQFNNKVPFSIFEELVSNYRTIYRRDKTESAAQIYRLKEADPMWPDKKVGDYVVYYPKQKNSGANTNYSDDPDAIINIRQRHTLVMESHAHANFSAFFSGGDDSNEKAPLAYCVIGNVDCARVSFAGRVRLLNKEKRMEIHELFDVPASISEPLLVENLTLPEPSAQMLINATPVTSYYKTAAQIAEEREKNGIVTPTRTYVGHNWYDEDYSGFNTAHSYYSGSYAGSYTGQTNVRNKRSHFAKNEDDFRGIDTDKYRNKYSSKAEKKAARALNKVDLEWVVENLNASQAIKMLELLTERVEKDYGISGDTSTKNNEDTKGDK